MRKFHLDLLGLKLVPNAKVIFGSFKRRRTLEPVEWHVAQGDEETFANAVENLERAGAVPVPIVEV
ncbi:hypothetical protein BE17_26180 [Sorangium cellulosum]|uniref:Uncharacterized protein n=1 Tax=Sorangium cellulosum TaxID=56 RepID=A0A150SJA6_SORCE|nr:hypothetical protein BE17_26180 [Sorangium cellulosum]